MKQEEFFFGLWRKVQDLNGSSLLNSGETEQTSETAKLMSGRLELAMVLEFFKGGHALSLAAQSLADSCDLGNHVGPVVAECIDTCFELPGQCERQEASTFPFTAQVHGHASVVSMHGENSAGLAGSQAGRRQSESQQTLQHMLSVFFKASQRPWHSVCSSIWRYGFCFARPQDGGESSVAVLHSVRPVVA